MSVKKLDKSIIEGGQHRGSKEERKQRHHMERQAARAYISDVLKNMDTADEEVIEQPSKSHGWFYASTKVVYRWLNKQIGRPWSEVHSELITRIDSDSVRDQIDRYVIQEIESPQERYWKWSNPPEDPGTSYHRNDFYVDEAGLLQKKKYLGRRHFHGESMSFADTKKFADWLNGRIVGQVGNQLFWFVPADKNKKRGGYSRIWRISWGHPPEYSFYYGRYGYYGFYFQYLDYEVTYKRDAMGNFVVEDGKRVEIDRQPKWRVSSVPAFRQDQRLTDKEVEYWNSIPESYRKQILEHSPNYDGPTKKDSFYY